jgi:hypothetical protein
MRPLAMLLRRKFMGVGCRGWFGQFCERGEFYEASLTLTGAFALLTGTLQVADMHFDQCSCGVLPVLPVQGGNVIEAR